MHQLVSVRHRGEDERPHGARGGARAGAQVRGSLKADRFWYCPIEYDTSLFPVIVCLQFWGVSRRKSEC